MANDRREAVEWLKRQHAEHARKTGQPIPDSRKIEEHCNEVGRRNDAQDREKK